MQDQRIHKESIRQEVWSFVKTLSLFLLLFFIIRGFIMQPFIVRGQSMEETFQDGDYLVVDELSYRFRDPERLEVVVFEADFINNQPNGTYYIKRIVGLPGDTVTISSNHVKITNQKYPEGLILDEGYLDEAYRSPQESPLKVNLGAEEYFVLGDNRNNSSDSRTWGTLKEQYIIGRPFVRLFPFDEITLY